MPETETKPIGNLRTERFWIELAVEQWVLDGDTELARQALELEIAGATKDIRGEMQRWADKLVREAIDAEAEVADA